MGRTLNRRSFLQRVALGASAATVGIEIAPATASVASDDGSVNLRTAGAAGDGSEDDGPALQSALNRLAAEGGGTLVVPPGVYRIASPVSRDFPGAVVLVVGAGSSSRFLLATGPAAPAITIQNAESVLLEDLVFLGTPGRLTDARFGIRLEVCLHASFGAVTSTV